MALPTGPELIGYIRQVPVYLNAQGPYVVEDYGEGYRRHYPVVECALCGEYEYDGDDIKIEEQSVCGSCANTIMNLKHYKHTRRYITWPNEERASARSSRRPIKPALRRRVHERDYYACRYCGARQQLVLDHLVPVSRGGENTFENLVTACTPCNTRKLDKTIEEAGLTLHPPEAFAHG